MSFNPPVPSQVLPSAVYWVHAIQIYQVLSTHTEGSPKGPPVRVTQEAYPQIHTVLLPDGSGSQTNPAQITDGPRCSSCLHGHGPHPHTLVCQCPHHETHSTATSTHPSIPVSKPRNSLYGYGPHSHSRVYQCPHHETHSKATIHIHTAWYTSVHNTKLTQNLPVYSRICNPDPTLLPKRFSNSLYLS